MRSLYSKDIIDNPYQVSPFQQRSRLKSLKELRQLPFEEKTLGAKYAQQQILQLLQKKLIEENCKQQNEEVHTVDPKKHSLHLPSKHSFKQQSQKKLQNLKQTNKLFQYFEDLFKKEVPAEKVEREKVNFCEKQFEEIKNKVQSKLVANKKKLQELEQIVKGKYLQLHEYHEQAKALGQKIKEQRKLKQSIQQQKKQRQGTNSQQKSTTTMSLRPPSLKQKLFIMEQSISYLKQETSKLEEEIETTNNKELSIEEEWVLFLKLFLNCGHYLTDGCERVLHELRKMNVKLNKDDLMTELIDENAKKYLLAYYQQAENGQMHSPRKDNASDLSNVFNKLSSQDHRDRQRIRSTIEMKSLAKESNLKHIYSNTKSAMMNLLKNSQFRTPSEKKPQKQSFLPKIQPRIHSVSTNQSRLTTLHDHNGKGKHQNLPIEQLKKLEINRVNHIYFGSGAQMEEKGKLIKRILFGFSVK